MHYPIDRITYHSVCYTSRGEQADIILILVGILLISTPKIPSNAKIVVIKHFYHYIKLPL